MLHVLQSFFTRKLDSRPDPVGTCCSTAWRDAAGTPVMPWGLHGLHGAFCFPSLSLYVTCCPNLEVTTPQLAGCPLEFQDTKCCTEDATATFLSLADVAPEHEDHKETMNLLWYFLRDIDLLSLDAWRLLVKGTAQAANFRMFEFKSGLKILGCQHRGSCHQVESFNGEDHASNRRISAVLLVAHCHRYWKNGD